MTDEKQTPQERIDAALTELEDFLGDEGAAPLRQAFEAIREERAEAEKPPAEDDSTRPFSRDWQPPPTGIIGAPREAPPAEDRDGEIFDLLQAGRIDEVERLSGARLRRGNRA